MNYIELKVPHNMKKARNNRVISKFPFLYNDSQKKKSEIHENYSQVRQNISIQI